MKPEQMFRLVGTSTVGPKGQVVIPADVRESMGIKPGDKLIALHIQPKNVIAFVTEEHVQHMVDKLGSQLDGLKDALKSAK